MAVELSLRDAPLLKAIAVAHEQLEMRIAANLEDQRVSILNGLAQASGRPREANAQLQERPAADLWGPFGPGARLPRGSAAALDGPAGAGGAASSAFGGVPPRRGGLGGKAAAPALGGAAVAAQVDFPSSEDSAAALDELASEAGTLHSAGDAESNTRASSARTGIDAGRVRSSRSTSSRIGEVFSFRYLTGKMASKNKGLAHSLSGELAHIQQGRQMVLDGASGRTVSSRSCTGMLNRVLARPEIEMLVACAIILNAASIGSHVDWRIKNAAEEAPVEYRVVDVTFVVVFAVELLLRIIAAGGTPFFQWTNKQLGWNVFDCILVCVTLLNEFNPFSLNLSVVRVFRVFRLAHVVRMIRLLKDFRELRLMVTGILNCGKTLLWSFIILFTLTYIYAVFCLQIIAEWQTHEEMTSENALSVKDNFRSLSWSMYVLIQAVLGGVSWGEVSTPMEEVSTLLRISFPLYVIVIVLCVLNIITASFVEAAQRTSQDEDTKFIEHIDGRQIWIQKLQDVFATHDSEGDQMLDWNEFQDVMGPNNWRAQTLFREIGLDLDYQDIKTLFDLFDVDGNRRIDVNEFAQSIFHYRGNARSVDMVRHFRQLEKAVEQNIDRAVEKIVDRAFSYVGAHYPARREPRTTARCDH